MVVRDIKFRKQLFTTTLGVYEAILNQHRSRPYASCSKKTLTNPKGRINRTASLWRFRITFVRKRLRSRSLNMFFLNTTTKVGTMPK